MVPHSVQTSVVDMRTHSSKATDRSAERGRKCFDALECCSVAGT